MNYVLPFNDILPQNSEDVVSLQEAVKNLIGISLEDNKYQNSAIERLIKDLTTLQGTLESQEQNFFNRFTQLSNKKPMKALQQIQQVLDELNADPGFGMMVNDGQLGEIIAVAARAGETGELVNLNLNLNEVGSLYLNDSILQTYWYEEIEKMAGKAIKDDEANIFTISKVNLWTAFNKALKSAQLSDDTFLNITPVNPRQTSVGVTGLFSTGENSEITVKFQNNKVTSITGIVGKPSDGLITRLEELTFDINRNQNVNPKYRGVTDQKQLAKMAIADQIQQIVDRNILNSELRGYVDEEFESRIKFYDVNKSASSIKGFLGEIHANAFFRYMSKKLGFLGSTESISPTGNLHRMLNGKKVEIPIDAFIEDAGFQIKNYQLTSGNVYFSQDSKDIPTVLDEHFKLPTDSSELIKAFFASEQYNQPASSANETYQSIYDNFNSMHSLVTDFLKMFAGNSLKFAPEFAIVEQNMTKPAQYYNTFFIINRYFVPSSLMVKAIIQSVKDALKSNYAFQDGSLVKANIYYPKIKVDSSNMNLSRSEEKRLKTIQGNVYPQKSTISNVLEGLSMGYDISLNIQQIIQQALSMITQG